jgi:UPF0716 protein FxsA
MRLLLLLLILLAFPVVEVVLLVRLAGEYGWGLLAYLLFAAICGWQLIQDERWMAFGRMADAMRGGDHPIRALLTSAKKVLAGLLLIFPGVLSDVLAVLILLIPAPGMKAQVKDDGVIEGEWRREE